MGALTKAQFQVVGSDLQYRLYDTGTGTWGTLRTLVDIGSLGGLSPGLDGTGAFGLWNISISGLAAVASSVDFAGIAFSGLTTGHVLVATGPTSADFQTLDPDTTFNPGYKIGWGHIGSTADPRPTTISGYGITDALTTTGAHTWAGTQTFSLAAVGVGGFHATGGIGFVADAGTTFSGDGSGLTDIPGGSIVGAVGSATHATTADSATNATHASVADAVDFSGVAFSGLTVGTVLVATSATAADFQTLDPDTTFNPGYKIGWSHIGTVASPTPTTVAGYGITDALTTTGAHTWSGTQTFSLAVVGAGGFSATGGAGFVDTSGSGFSIPSGGGTFSGNGSNLVGIPWATGLSGVPTNISSIDQALTTTSSPTFASVSAQAGAVQIGTFTGSGVALFMSSLDAILSNQNNGVLIFGTNNTERGRILSTGALSWGTTGIVTTGGVSAASLGGDGSAVTNINPSNISFSGMTAGQVLRASSSTLAGFDFIVFSDISVAPGAIAWSKITPPGTTLSSYGITDGLTTTGAHTWAGTQTFSVQALGGGGFKATGGGGFIDTSGSGFSIPSGGGTFSGDGSGLTSVPGSAISGAVASATSATSAGSVSGTVFDTAGTRIHAIVAVTTLPTSFTGYEDGTFFAVTS